MAMTLTSPAFGQGGTIPRAHTCEGADIPPAFLWSGVPEGTVSLFLACEDGDAPGGVFHHWAAWGIPPDAGGLGEGARPPREAVNGFGRRGYGGPCPPRGDRPHRYVFRLSALSGTIEAPPGATCAEVVERARSLTIGTAELVGRFGR